MAPSNANKRFFNGKPPPKPPKLPPAANTRCQGTNKEIGFFAMACPAARAALGEPAEAAKLP